MKVEIKVPTMGESIVQATVGEIFKPNGSAVSENDEILELETDKVNQVLYAPHSGVIELSIASEETVEVGQVIGYVDTEGAASKLQAAAGAKEPKEVAPPPAPLPKPQAVESPASGARFSKEDYVNELKAPKEPSKPVLPTAAPASAPSGEVREVRKKMSRLRQVIAQRLVEVQQKSAMLTTFNEVDMKEVMALREKHQERFVKDHGIKLGFMSFFVKASVSALKAFPEVNAYIDGADIVYRNSYDVSVAVGTDKGLFVPVVRNCDRLSFADVEQQIADLAKKARDGKLSVEDLQGGGFTITNGGIYGSLLSTPILNPPQSAILGMHSIQKRPVAIGDEIAVRPMMYLALSYDHRIIDGKEAVSFLVHIKKLLEDPSRLLIDG